MQVQAALIIMTIMGCDDSGSQCAVLAENQTKWETVAQCDDASEGALDEYSNANYPVIVAVCQTETAVGTAEATTPESATDLAAAPPPPPPSTEDKSPKTLVELVSNLADKAKPLTDSVKSVLIDKPVHVAKDSYSWVVRKLR